MVEAADARERVEWHRTAGLALMVGGLFSSVDPWGVVPPEYRPGAAPGTAGQGKEKGKAKPKADPRDEMTAEERELRQEIALASLGAALRQGSR